MVNQSGYSEYVRRFSIEQLITTAANLINAQFYVAYKSPQLAIKLLFSN